MLSMTPATAHTGSFTTVCALGDIVLYLSMNINIHLILNYPLCKVYTNSLMSSLNARYRWDSGSEAAATDFGASFKKYGTTVWSRVDTQAICPTYSVSIILRLFSQQISYKIQAEETVWQMSTLLRPRTDTRTQSSLGIEILILNLLLTLALPPRACIESLWKMVMVIESLRGITRS
jgi:hypothetical protein